MVRYKCGVCGKEFTEEEMTRLGPSLKCPECGSEIIYKVARNYRLVKAI